VVSSLTHGGSERQLYELLRGIDQKRFRCFVYCLSDMTFPYGSLMQEAGAELRVLKRQGYFDVTRVVKLAHRVRRDRIEILHSFLFHANGYAWPAWCLAAAPHLVTSARNCQGYGFLRDWVNRLAMRQSDAIMCNGEAVRSFVAQHYGAPAVRCPVIYNGVDLERFAPPPAAGAPGATGDPGEKVVLTIGRLVPQKDLTLFLQAAGLLLQRLPEVRFLVVGDGPHRALLEDYAAENGLRNRVVFLGERTDVPDLLRRANVFWLTSAWEGLPNVLLEALACAKPVVARDVGSCGEIISHGVNGYLVPRRDATAFVQYTLPLLSNAAQACAMGQAGRRLIEEKFSLPAMIATTEKLYDSILTA
jgi:glycosyltransferase involved in cell wall biosynthesis